MIIVFDPVLFFKDDTVHLGIYDELTQNKTFDKKYYGSKFFML